MHTMCCQVAARHASVPTAGSEEQTLWHRLKGAGHTCRATSSTPRVVVRPVHSCSWCHPSAAERWLHIGATTRKATHSTAWTLWTSCQMIMCGRCRHTQPRISPPRVVPLALTSTRAEKCPTSLKALVFPGEVLHQSPSQLGPLDEELASRWLL